MIIRRWQAEKVPTKEQIKMIFDLEGLEPIEETYPPKCEINEHRQPFDEIRVVVSGELLVNVSGNQLLLRAGDRIEIPSNTKHSTKVNGEQECFSIYARRIPL